MRSPYVAGYRAAQTCRKHWYTTETQPRRASGPQRGAADIQYAEAYQRVFPQVSGVLG
jgi:hypothetical protein